MEAPPFVWLVLESEEVAGTPGKWTPLRRTDSERLEVALRTGQGGQNIVAVEGGRFDVDLARRRLRPVFWEEPERRVIRSLWFKQPSGKDIIPYEEEDSAELENALQRLRNNKATAPLLVPVEKGRHDVRFELKPKEEPSGLAAWFSGPDEEAEPQYTVVQESVDRSASKDVTPVWRWYFSAVDNPNSAGEDESQLPERVECLVFVVHGIGQFHKWASDSPVKFHKDVAKVRHNAVKRLLERKNANMPVPGRLEFLPLEWFETIHKDAAVGDRLKDITLPTVGPLRDFANFAVADLMVYQDEEWREELQRDLRERMAKVYETFCKRTPDFSGQVAIMGHSLGSVIMFDLIQGQLQEHQEGFLTGATAAPSATAESTKKPWPCPAPRCFFAVGSPLGMFLSIRVSKRKEQKVPQYFRGIDLRWPVAQAGRGWRIFNIFHPDDPIAYRLEPLLNVAYASQQPRLVPCGGGLRLHHQLREWWRGGSEQDKEAMAAKPSEEQPLADVLRVFTAGLATPAAGEPATEPPAGELAPEAIRPPSVTMERMDYALQETMTESMNELLSALNSHFMYWDNPDLASFVVDQALDAIQAKPGEQNGVQEEQHGVKEDRE